MSHSLISSSILVLVSLVLISPALGTSPEAQRAIEQGLALDSPGHYAEARDSYSEAIRLDPKSFEAWYKRGWARDRLGDCNGAIGDFDQALRLEPGNATAWNGRGAARNKAGNVAGALEDFQKAIDLNPTYSSPRANRALLRLKQKDFRGALDDAEQALRLNPSAADVWHTSGTARWYLADYKGSIADFTRAIDLNGKSAANWDGRASARLKIGDNRGALEDLERALALNPKNADVLVNRGTAKKNLGDLAGARADYQQALALNASDASAKRGLAVLDADQSSTKAAGSAQNNVRPGPTIAGGPVSTPAESPARPVLADAAAVLARPASSDAVATAVPAPEPSKSFRVLAPFAGYSMADPCKQSETLPGVPWRPGASPAGGTVGSAQLGQYQAMLRHTMEGLRLLYGPLSPTEEKSFNAFWAPFFDHPTKEALDYFQQITPLLDDMTVTLSNLDGLLPGMGEALQGTMLAGGDPTSGAARVAAVQYQRIKAERARLDDLAQKLSALGNPPNPIAAKCAAHQHHRQVIPKGDVVNPNDVDAIFFAILQREYDNRKQDEEVRNAERIRRANALNALAGKKANAVRQNINGALSDEDLKKTNADLDAQAAAIDRGESVPAGPGTATAAGSASPATTVDNQPTAGQTGPQRPDPEDDPKVNAEAMAVHVALAGQTRREADRWAADAAKEKDPTRRKEMQDRAAVMYANAQSENDIAESLRTGTMVHTRTSWDEQQHQKVVGNIKTELAAFAAEDKLLANIPKVADMVAGIDGLKLREQAQNDITEAIHSPDAVKKLAAIYAKVQDKVVDQGQHEITAAQDKVNLWERRLAVAENVEMAAGMGVAFGALWAPAEIGTLALGYAGSTGFAEGGVKGATVAVVRSVSSRADVIISAYEGATKIDPATGQAGGAWGAVEGALWSIGTNKALESVSGRIQQAKAEYALARQAAGGPGFKAVARAGEGRLSEFDFQSPEQRYKTELAAAPTPQEQAAINQKHAIQVEREAMGTEKEAARQRAEDAVRQGADRATAMEQYNRDLKTIDERSATKETRNQEHQEVMKELGFDLSYDGNNKDIKPTGSKPKTAESDMDFTPVGSPHEAYQKGKAYTEAMKKRGHHIDEYGDRWVDTTSDTTVWKPGFGADKPGSGSFEAETIFGSLPNSDKFGTKGGIEWTSSETHTTDDPLGAVLANAGKAAGAGLGNSRPPDLHVIGKSAVKAAEAAGIDVDPELKAQIEALKAHQTPEQAGVVDLGADQATKDQQVKSFLGKVQALMGRAFSVAKAKSEQNFQAIDRQAAAGAPNEADGIRSKLKAYQAGDEAAISTIAQVSPGLAGEMGRSAKPADLMPADPANLNFGGLTRALAQDRDSEIQAPPLPADSSDPAFSDLGRRCKLAAHNCAAKLAAAKPGSDEARYLAELKTALEQGGDNPAEAVRTVRGLAGMELPVVLAQLGAPAK